MPQMSIKVQADRCKTEQAKQTSSRGSRPLVSPLDEVGGLLSHHDDRDVDVAARNRWKNRTVDHPQSGNVPDPEFGVNHSTGIAIERSHLAGADGVVIGGG